MSESFPTMRFRFLGTSTSVGVPVIGCICDNCTSPDPRDNRTRSSGFLEGPFGKILIDSGPDLREQALREKISSIDAVIYTHAHIDHVAGFDELRAFCWRREDLLPLHGSQETLTALKQMYPWAFTSEKIYPGYVRPAPIAFEESFRMNELLITPIEVDHGNVRTHGFRFDFPGCESLAYISDVKSIPSQSLELLAGVDILAIDTLRESHHHTHMSLSEALATIDYLKPKKSYLTHISHEIDCRQVAKSLPANVEFAYDGLTLDLNHTPTLCL
ncbi:MAG: MBL fold metallo-hydrolase [Verrucomicrobiaceae bacterium]